MESGEKEEAKKEEGKETWSFKYLCGNLCQPDYLM